VEIVDAPSRDVQTGYAVTVTELDPTHSDRDLVTTGRIQSDRR
jgi:hypothetical protein